MAGRVWLNIVEMVSKTAVLGSNKAVIKRDDNLFVTRVLSNTTYIFLCQSVLASLFWCYIYICIYIYIYIYIYI